MERPLTVTLHGLPVLVCEHGHRQFLHAKLALQRLLQATGGPEGDLPISDEKGFWFRRPVCADCGARLEHGAGQPQTFQVEVALGEEPALRIDLTMPVSRCSGCGKEQVRSRKEILGRTPAALVRALRAAGVAQE